MVKVKELIAVNGTPSHSYGVSLSNIIPLVKLTKIDAHKYNVSVSNKF